MSTSSPSFEARDWIIIVLALAVMGTGIWASQNPERGNAAIVLLTAFVALFAVVTVIVGGKNLRVARGSLDLLARPIVELRFQGDRERTMPAYCGHYWDSDCAYELVNHSAMKVLLEKGALAFPKVTAITPSGISVEVVEVSVGPSIEVDNERVLSWPKSVQDGALRRFALRFNGPRLPGAEVTVTIEIAVQYRYRGVAHIACAAPTQIVFAPPDRD